MNTVQEDIIELGEELSAENDQLKAKVADLKRELASWKQTLLTLASHMDVAGQVEVALRLHGVGEFDISDILDTFNAIRR